MEFLAEPQIQGPLSSYEFGLEFKCLEQDKNSEECNANCWTPATVQQHRRVLRDIEGMQAKFLFQKCLRNNINTGFQIFNHSGKLVLSEPRRSVCVIYDVTRAS